jgi:predicted nucleic acid-binding protein
LLDTNVLSEATRPRPEARLLEWLEAVDEDRLFIIVVSIAEIRRCVALLSRGRRRWGDVMAASQASGATLEPLDAFFAATALAYDLTLATRNVRDFQACGVRLFNPWTIGEA